MMAFRRDIKTEWDLHPLADATHWKVDFSKARSSRYQRVVKVTRTATRKAIVNRESSRQAVVPSEATYNPSSFWACCR